MKGGVSILLYPVVVPGGAVGYYARDIINTLGLGFKDLLSRYGAIVYNISSVESGEHGNSPTPGIPCLMKIEDTIEMRLVVPEEVGDSMIVDARFINTCCVLIQHGCQSVSLTSTAGELTGWHSIWFNGEWHKLTGTGFNGKEIDITDALPD